MAGFGELAAPFDTLRAIGTQKSQKKSGFVATVFKVKWCEEKKFQTNEFYV
jgi:hypothetical protein